ncbi:hypothetical protein LCGC14_0789560 [marine sediment metagenome]|uniref:Uncharacterized protein n=1 Tax=marine sediment metagenome TaxID=412755 RepID=A0A0F9QCU8_9ZZZZ
MTEKIKDIRISSEIHKKLKLQAVSNGRTMKAELEDIINKNTNYIIKNATGSDIS